MKKYVTFLLILSISLFIFSEQVDAVKVTTSISSGYSTGITWNQTGTPVDTVFNSRNRGPYTDYKKAVVWLNQKYEAFCLDPGLSFRNGYTYNCSPTSEPGLIYLLGQYNGSNYSEIQLALRLYAEMKGFGSSKLAEMKGAMMRFWQIKMGFGNLILESCKNQGMSCSPNANDYLSGNDALLTTAYNLAYHTFYTTALSPSGTGGITFTKLASSSKSRIDYTVTTQTKINKIKFVCEGCTIIGPDEFESPARSIQLSVEPAPDCEPFKIKSYYVPSGVQLCTLANSSSVDDFQYVVADFDAESAESGSIDTSGDPTDVFQDRGVECEQDCCTDVLLEPNHIEGDVHNCCLDNTHSWAKEYDLNQLVCYSKEFEVDHYWKMCNSENYLDEKMNGDINEYCEILCTERVTVDVPGPITATSGRYFDLTTTSHGTKSPYIEGFKRCRTLINFKKWQDDYRKQVEEQIKQYNIYQENRIYELLYQDAIDASSECSLHIKVECTGETDEDSDICTHGIIPNLTSNTCGASADTTAETGVAFDSTRSYTRYKFVGAPHRDKPFNLVKLDQNGYKAAADGYYNYYKLMYDTSGTASHSNDWEYRYVKDMIESAHAAKDAKEAIVDTDSDDCCSASAGVSCTWTFEDSCGNSEGDLTSKIEDVPEVYSRYQEAAARANEAYNAAANAAKELERKIDKCDNYFTKYEGTNAEENFPFNSTFLGFEYTQIYLSDYGDLKKDINLIPFDSAPGCVITGPTLGPDSEDLLIAPEYSTKYVDGDHITQTKDFKNTLLEWQEAKEGFRVFEDEEYEVDQKFVQDIKYKATCSWNEPENTKYTLVQRGEVMQSDFNTTKNDRQYSVHLTTLEGTYDTRWLLSGLGTNSKFDYFFAENGAVCSGKQNAINDGLFHCVLKVEYEIISTGKCNGERSTTETEECEKKSGTEAELNFKIVDPAQVFTCNSVDECGYGYNWFETDGSKTLNEIRRKGANTETYSPNNRTYQVTLTANDMKHVQNYNEYRENNNYGGYSDFSLLCECPDSKEECNEVGGTQTCKRSESCRKCRSTFLNNLYSGYISYGGGDHSVTGSKESIETIRNNGHVHWAG